MVAKLLRLQNERWDLIERRTFITILDGAATTWPMRLASSKVIAICGEATVDKRIAIS